MKHPDRGAVCKLAAFTYSICVITLFLPCPADSRSDSHNRIFLFHTLYVHSFCTMPRFARFYSATEAEATISLRQLVSRQPKSASPFNSESAEQLTNLLNGTTASTSGSRNGNQQPLFLPTPAEHSVEELLNASTFSVTEEYVIRDKHVEHESSSDRSVEWMTRSRTPSSDEPSPRKHQIASPIPSLGTEVVDTSGGSNNALAYM